MTDLSYWLAIRRERRIIATAATLEPVRLG
jgi:hypothetical protein